MRIPYKHSLRSPNDSGRSVLVLSFIMAIGSLGCGGGEPNPCAAARNHLETCFPMALQSAALASPTCGDPEAAHELASKPCAELSLLISTGKADLLQGLYMRGVETWRWLTNAPAPPVPDEAPPGSCTIGIPAGTTGLNGDAVLDRLNPFELYNSWFLGVPNHQLAPRSFFEDDGRGPVVGINGVAMGELYREASDYMTGAYWDQACPHVYQYRVKDPEDWLEHLVTVRQQAGPIARMVVAAHGMSGLFMVGGVEVGRAWAEANKERLARLPRDLFRPDAQVVLISCSVAAGLHGAASMGTDGIRAVFGPLLKAGGTVVASRRYVNPDYATIPSQFKNPRERFIRHLQSPLLSVFGTLEWLVADWVSKMHKVSEVTIPPSE